MVSTRKQIKISLPTKIADELRHDILLNILKSGEMLNEIALAEKYGVSRGPIRQAVAMLSNEGIIEALPNGRTRVIGFKSAEMQDYYDLRLYIETEAIKKVLSQPDDQDFRDWLNRLNEIIKRCEDIQLLHHDEQLHELDYEFHLSIVEHADSKISQQVWKMLSNFNRSIMTLKKLYLANQELGSFDSTIKSHTTIVSALASRDLEAALKELAWHIENSIQIYKKILSGISSV